MYNSHALRLILAMVGEHHGMAQRLGGDQVLIDI